MLKKDFKALLQSIKEAKQLANPEPPIMGAYYKIFFFKFNRWIVQPGEAKCLGVFRQWVTYNHKASIEEVPVFVYQEAFLLASDCKYLKV